MLRHPLNAVLLALTLAAPSAHATYSIVAVEPATGHVGVAVASCVADFDLAPLFRVVPFVGVVQTQAHYGFYGQTRLAELLSDGIAPGTAVELVTDPRFDPRRESRQYGVVDFFGRAAAFSGHKNGLWIGDLTGSRGGVTYSAQGNILTDASVLTALESGLTRTDACDLAERLMFALEAVTSVAGRGDNRCTSRGVSADSGHLRVAASDGTTLLELTVLDTQSDEPVALLRTGYDEFRRAAPCGSLPAEALVCRSE